MIESSLKDLKEEKEKAQKALEELKQRCSIIEEIEGAKKERKKLAFKQKHKSTLKAANVIGSGLGKFFSGISKLAKESGERVAVREAEEKALLQNRKNNKR